MDVAMVKVRYGKDKGVNENDKEKYVDTGYLSK